MVEGEGFELLQDSRGHGRRGGGRGEGGGGVYTSKTTGLMF